MSTEFNSKWVRRFTVDSTAKHKNGFTIYKITSYLFPIDSPETVTIVTVWKRYSDIQKLHKCVKTLHTGLHLPGNTPTFNKWSYFKRFDPEVIEDRVKSTKTLLEFIGQHNLLFTSTEFVQFLKSGYDDPEFDCKEPISSIRSELKLPNDNLLTTLVYDSDDESGSVYADAIETQEQNQESTELQDPSKIEILEPFDCELPLKPDKSKTCILPHEMSKDDSFDSLSTLSSDGSLPYDEIMKQDINKILKAKHTLPDLINFDEQAMPSTSKLDTVDLTDRKLAVSKAAEKIDNSDSSSETSVSICQKFKRSDSRISVTSKRSLSSYSMLSVDIKCKTEDSYVFEAGYLLNLASRAEECCDFKKAFDFYKCAIEKMLVGVQTDSDTNRKLIIKEKINKYLLYAEKLYNEHTKEIEENKPPEQINWDNYKTSAIPLSMLHRPYDELRKFRLLGLIEGKLMLVFDTEDRKRYAMKVIQKIPQNLTEFDTIFSRQIQDVKRPILPTNVPYMVQLCSYIETPNLVFLVLNYASGGKLCDYIKKYAKSLPCTPKKININNVIKEPKVKLGKNIPKSDDNIPISDGDKMISDNCDSKSDKSNPLSDEVPSDVLAIPLKVDGSRKMNNLKTNLISGKNLDKLQSTNPPPKDSKQMSVDDMVQNAQKLLKNVDVALTGQLSDVSTSVKSYAFGLTKFKSDATGDADAVIVKEILQPSPKKYAPSDILPPSTICKWAAEILIAIENLHCSGVVCRDLNLSNIMLGERGQTLLTYFVGYSGEDLTLSIVRRSIDRDPKSLHMAPELLNMHMIDKADCSEKSCDFWSFGAILYELVCGCSLSSCHNVPFTSHTELQLPNGLSEETASILTQLLTYDPSERLGAKGVEEIKKHQYFKNIDWNDVLTSWTNSE